MRRDAGGSEQRLNLAHGIAGRARIRRAGWHVGADRAGALAKPALRQRHHFRALLGG